MNFLKKIIKARNETLLTNEDFWNWFNLNQKSFFKTIKGNKNIEKNFFDKLFPKINELKEGYFYLAGMYDDNTVELVLTADGNVKNIVFVEELVSCAPDINGWKFTSLKPALSIEDVNIGMAGYDFNKSNIKFYSQEIAEYPDEIDITIVHDDLTEENKNQISNGIYIFLDNYLGELDFVKNIDNLSIIVKKEVQNELIPIDKLKDYLNWRQKEFIEKYESVYSNIKENAYSLFEAELENGSYLMAVINTDLLKWDSKASHPWISILILKYDGNNNNGMPNNFDFELLSQIEDEIMNELKDIDGYLNIGRQTAGNEREIYFASKDFRKPSKVFYKIQQLYSKNFEIDYDIYKDKYWQTFEKFIT